MVTEFVFNVPYCFSGTKLLFTFDFDPVQSLFLHAYYICGGKKQACQRVFRRRCGTITHNIPHGEKWEQRIGQTKDKEDLMSCRSSKFSSLPLFSSVQACAEGTLPKTCIWVADHVLRSILVHVTRWMIGRSSGGQPSAWRWERMRGLGSLKPQDLIDRCNIRSARATRAMFIYWMRVRHGAQTYMSLIY